MALIHISQKELCALGGLKPSEVEDVLTALGIPLESRESDDLSLEITPNRPDWLSVEGVARSCFSWKTGKPKSYAASNSSIHWTIDPTVRPVRPILGSALARNVKMSDGLLVSLMQLQEKLHDTLGRKRKKMAIGVHDLSSVKPPFTYKAVGRDEVRFIPLGKMAPMTPGQILLEHEKGVDYAHLVGDACPLIVDKDGEVLSFPPIINGERTRVSADTTDLLIDCTGTSEEAVRVTVNILCAALADRGAKIEQVHLDGKPYELFSSTIWKMPPIAAAASKLLGVKLGADEASRLLCKTGHGANARLVSSPAFRADLMHDVDLVEEIAIAIGLNNLPMPLPDFSTEGQMDAAASPLHETMLGLGYFEVMSWILTSQSTLSKSGVDVALALRVNNPLTEEFTTLRPLLYPNLLEIFSRSKSESLPQYLYEIGVVEQPKKDEREKSGDEQPKKDEAGKFEEIEHLTAAAIHPKSCFSQIHSHLGGLLAACAKSVTFEPVERPGFISGRAARLLHEKQEVGFIGEIHPAVLESFGLEQPVALFEIQTDFLKR